MLKRENRLKKNKHFNYIYKHGQSVKTQNLSLIYIKTKVRPFQVGFSVSNKIGKAVVRNKVKRRMREIFAEIIPKIDRRYNYIFVAKEGIAELTFEQLKMQMHNAIKKASLFNEEKSNI